MKSLCAMMTTKKWEKEAFGSRKQAKKKMEVLMDLNIVTGVTSLHSRSVLGRDSNKELSSIQAKGTSKGCEQSVVD